MESKLVLHAKTHHITVYSPKSNEAHLSKDKLGKLEIYGGVPAYVKAFIEEHNTDESAHPYIQENLSTLEGTVTEHIEDTNNPHAVTKEQVGLGNVDNTSDADKPISTATQAALDSKQATISDLATIRSGAALGATAVQPGDLATVATTGSYNDLTNKPTIGNATLTIQKNGTSAGTFTANATSNETINITVPTTAADVDALPDTTKYGASLDLNINSSTYVVTAQLKDQDGNTLGTAQTIDLPLESVVVSGSYDSANKKVVLTLQNGSTVEFSVADLVAGLQSEITSSNKLSADLVDDTNTAHKFVTATQRSKIDTAVQPADLPTVNNGTLTIQTNGTTVGTFTANQSGNTTANIIVPDSAAWGNITGDIADQTDLQDALADKQDKLTAGTDISIIGGSSSASVVSGVNTLNMPNAVANSLNYVRIYGKCEQTGTPTFDSPIDIICNNGAIKWDKVNNKFYADGTAEIITDSLSNTVTAEMLLSLGDYVDNQEILTGAIIRNVGVKVLDGTESFNTGNLSNCYSLDVDLGTGNLTDRTVYCTHFRNSSTLPAANNRQGYALIGNKTTPSNSYTVGFGATTRFSTATLFKDWLAQQYANGTPVIIVYPLTVPTTETVTGQILTTKQGDNTISVSQSSISSLNLTASYMAEGDTIISFTNATGYITGIDSTDVTTALGYTPQEQISDLATIRSGAAAGATALQPETAEQTYLKLSGGTLTGDLFIQGSNNKLFGFKRTNSNTNIDIGWDWASNAGAGAAFRSVDATASQGIGNFYIWARNNSGTTTQLIGTPDGSLTWGNSEVQTAAKKGVANGIATLDSNTKVPVAQIPDLSSTYATKTELSTKQDTISDLSTIRSNASAGANAATTIAGYGDIVSHDASEFALDSNTVHKTGDETIAGAKTFTGKVVSPIVETGSAASNYFQCQKFRGEGNANTYYHAIDFGYANHDQVDFYEYGGKWVFHKHTGSAQDSGDTVVGQILSTGWNGPVVGNVTGNVTGNLTGTASKATADADGNTISSTYTKKTDIMTGATSSAAGTSGLVPAPAAGDEAKFLRGDGTWVGSTSAAVWGSLTGTLSDQTDLQNALNAKQSTLSTAQLNAANSGITSTKVGNYDTHIANSDIHVTAANKTTWDGKQDAISDLSTIRSNASSGASAATTIAGYGNIVTHNASEFALDSSTVHTTGNETIGGTKTFSSEVIGVSPAASDDSTKLATTAWVRALLGDINMLGRIDFDSGTQFTISATVTKSKTTSYITGMSTYTILSDGYISLLELGTTGSGDAIISNGLLKIIINGVAVARKDFYGFIPVSTGDVVTFSYDSSFALSASVSAGTYMAGNFAFLPQRS